MEIRKKRLFFGGLAVGIILTIVINFFAGFAGDTYASLMKKEMQPNEKISRINSILKKYYVDEVDDEKLVEGMYQGYVYGIGDPYTSYMDKDLLSKFKESVEGSFTGIGLYVSPDVKANRIIVMSPIEGTPAEKAGIKAKDIILKVNGFDVYAETLNEAVSMMKGLPGTKVNVTIFRESENKTFDLDVIREKIDVPTVSHKMLEGAIGYIRLIGFEAVTYDQFMIAYNELTKAGMRALIIDLRNNPGGLLDIVTKIADELVPKGYIVYTEDKEGKTNYTYSDDKRINVPVAVLVNGNSASASEVLAGAIKDLNVGVLVGTQTFGKGLVQTLFELPDGSGVKVTIAKYYTPSGVCINGIGLTPDFPVSMDEDLTFRIPELTFEEDVQLQKAVGVVNQKLQPVSKK